MSEKTENAQQILAFIIAIILVTVWVVYRLVCMYIERQTPSKLNKTLTSVNTQ